MKLWSEVPHDRSREVTADVATFVWAWIWSWVALRLYGFLSEFAGAGRTVAEGGRGLAQTGVELGDALRGVPLVGEDAARTAERSFLEAGMPFVQLGTELEAFILVAALVLSLVVLALPLLPWLLLYLPWRIRRLRRLRAAERAVRRGAPIPEDEMQRLLASRALNRLPFEDLLQFTPDPFGDWAAGRHERLARAELASGGLEPR